MAPKGIRMNKTTQMLTIVKKKKTKSYKLDSKKIDIDHNVDVCFSCGLARKKNNKQWVL